MAKLPMRHDFETIPQAPRYEINSQGIIRNRETGQIIKWQKMSHCNTKQAKLFVGDCKYVCVSQPSLLWLLHGKITSKVAPHAIVVKKGTRELRLDSLLAGARFLAKMTGLTVGGVWYHLAKKRHTMIHGWQIHYCNSNKKTARRR